MRYRRPSTRLTGIVCLLAAAACGPSSQSGISRPSPAPKGTPLGLPATRTIGAAGGTLASPDGVLTVTAPAGSVAAPIELSIQPITNTAPGGSGGSYLLGPEGTTFSTPVTIVFQPPPGTSVAGLTVAYQDRGGYWFRASGVVRDAAARTLTAKTDHFSSWTLVPADPLRDLSGPFSYGSTLKLAGPDFTANGSAVLNFLGEDAHDSVYLAGGTLTLPASLASGTATCVPAGATAELDANIAEVPKSPLGFLWGVAARWNLTCSDGSQVLAFTAFDTAGISLVRCTRGYLGTPLIGPDRIQGSYAIDCGAEGRTTASWDFRAAACDQPCPSANPCHTATVSCATGSAVCVDTGNVADGTSCGTDMVCGGGVCNACTVGAPCPTPPDPLCHEGTTECGTGFPVCANGIAKANGTICGTDQVCSGGACVACAAGLSCTGQPDPLCHAGVTDCSTGTSVCVNGAALPNGTTCGTDLVCNGGSCVACAAGLSCTGQPDPFCHLGITDCSSGTSVCVDGAALPNGTGCGPNLVCSGGACVGCTAGLSCTGQPDPLCHLGATDCSTGTSVCVNGAARPNGTACGTDQVCNAGSCVACAAGLSCTGQPDPLCHAGVTDCSTGSSVCVDGAALPDGTSCGTGQTCNAGACVPSRTVAATRRATYWPDPPAAQETTATPDAATATVEALVANGSGGWVHYPPAPATFDGSGSASIANVPTGSYLLVFRDGGGVAHVVETSSSAVDLGYDVLGRASAVPATLPTTVSYALTGVAPGATEVQLTSSSADLWHLAALAGEDWALGGSSLLAAGDLLYLHDLAPAPVACGASTCQVATDWSSQVSAGMTDGLPMTITAVLAAATTSGSVTADWQTSAFEGLLSAMNPAATTDATAHTLLVGASAFPLANPAPFAFGGSPVLFRLQQPAGSPDVAAGPVSYGRFLDSLWSEWRGVDFSARVAYTAPSATTPLLETVSVGRREPMNPPPATPIAPTLGPVLAPALNGADAFSTLTGVGLTPTFSWSAPAVGVPTSYQLRVYRLYASGTASASALVASFTVAGTSTQVALPPGLLQAGETYYARIAARAIATGDVSGIAPFRTSNLWDEAQVLSGTFSP